MKTSVSVREGVAAMGCGLTPLETTQKEARWNESTR